MYQKLPLGIASWFVGGGAVTGGRHDGVAVDRVGDRLPDPHVVPRLAGLVEREVPVVVARRDREVDRVVVLELVDALRRESNRSNRFRRPAAPTARWTFSEYEPEDHARNLRRAAPVGRVGLQRDRVTTLLALEGERTGADRVGGDLAAFDILALHDRHALEAAEVGQQVRRGLLEAR